MRNRDDLERTLHSLDGQSYAAYRQIEGSYNLGKCELIIDRVQVDPYAPPSRVRLLLDTETAGIPVNLRNDAAGRIATADFLTRSVAREIRRIRSESDNEHPPRISIFRPGQEILERTSVIVDDDGVEARLSVGLPAAGRRIRGREAAWIMCRLLPRLVDRALAYKAVNPEALADHVELYRDEEFVRSQLADRSLVAFVGNGSILPRSSGDSDTPLDSGAVEFESPESLETSFDLPSGRRVSGMGIPEGVTVIVGGGYHGKSTLLRAIERGVYSHIGGDGREWVITRADAVSIRAEDGRAVAGVDISPFISDLPSGADTSNFSTTNASGSTSQAANLMEALEAGASALLIDEDTSATNFMIRDERMRRLIPESREPITPFFDRVRELYAERGVSTVLVAGGSGAFFDVMDHVIAMDAYVPRDATDEARAIAEEDYVEPDDGIDEEDAEFSAFDDPFSADLTTDRRGTGSDDAVFPAPAQRIPIASSLQPAGKTKPARASGIDTIRYGRDNDIELGALSQLVDEAQTAAIAEALECVAELADGKRPVTDIVDEIIGWIDEDGLDALVPQHHFLGGLARPRRHEIMAALNRYRGLRLA